MGMQQKTVDWVEFQITNSVVTESVVDDVTTFSMENVIRPHLQKITEAEDDIIAEFLMARGWTPPPGSRWVEEAGAEEGTSAESVLLSRLRRVLGKNLTRSDIDFLHVLKRDDVVGLALEYLAEPRTPLRAINHTDKEN